jgi:hypothetical protein
MRSVDRIPGMGGREIKENDEGGKVNDDILRPFVNVTVYPQYNNNS